MFTKQLSLFELPEDENKKQSTIQRENLTQYDRIIIAFSGGKDSLATLLLLLELGFGSKLELWHHSIDGASDDPNFFDWHITEGYCQAIALYFEIPLYFSYREGGFKREMMRDNQATAPVWYQSKDHTWHSTGGKGKPNTRLKFPMPTASLQTRWCSSYLKISVMDTAIRNQARFSEGKTLVITGERAEESAARAKYRDFEPHRTNSKTRHIDHWRPVLRWDREKVWKIIKKHGIIPHPAYYLGFSRTSCRNCIFLQKDDLSTLQILNSDQLEEIASLEQKFNSTIAYDQQRAKNGLPQLNVVDRAKQGKARNVDSAWAELAWSNTWDIAIAVSSGDWELPLGAYGCLDSGSP